MLTDVKQKKVYERAIRNWPKDDRPREKLIQNGEHTLTNSELLAILLRTGVKGQSALDLARKILQRFKTFRNMSSADLSHWADFKGLGVAKITQIKAAIEIGRRFREDETREVRQKIKSSKDVFDILMPQMRDLKKETFEVVLLDSHNKIIEIHKATEGTVNQANPFVREIFQRALQHNAVSIVCVHNHPSGDITPSQNDKGFTKMLIDAGATLQIKVLDHIIIGDNNYYSFDDEGLIKSLGK